jgi:hypothetical protein
MRRHDEDSGRAPPCDELVDPLTVEIEPVHGAIPGSRARELRVDLELVCGLETEVVEVTVAALIHHPSLARAL